MRVPIKMGINILARCQRRCSKPSCLFRLIFNALIILPRSPGVWIAVSDFVPCRTSNDTQIFKICLKIPIDSYISVGESAFSYTSSGVSRASELCYWRKVIAIDMHRMKNIIFLGWINCLNSLWFILAKMYIRHRPLSRGASSSLDLPPIYSL